MKKNIIKAFLFLFIVSLIIIILSNILIPKSNTKEAGIHYYDANGIMAEPKNTIDMVIVGDSEPFTAISPMELWKDYGYTSYLCSSLEARVYETVQILAKARNKQKPKVLLIEVSYLFRQSKISSAIESSLETFIPAMEYHDRWKELRKNDFTDKPEYKIINDLKGYKYTSQTESCEEKNIMDNTEYYEPNPVPRLNKLYFKLIKEYCKQNNIKIIAVRVPTMRDWNYASYMGAKRFLDKENIEFWDMNLSREDIKIDWATDSKDGGDHLNHKGALKTTKNIGKWLYNKHILKDHRNEKKYSDWKRSEREYDQIVNSN